MRITLATLMVLLMLSLACESEPTDEVLSEEAQNFETMLESGKSEDQNSESSATSIPAIAPRPTNTPSPVTTPESSGTPLAVMPSYTPEPTATAVPKPTATPVSSEFVQERRAEYITRCKHWALRNLRPVEYSKFEHLDPHEMTDLERVLWGSVIVNKSEVITVESYYSNSRNYGDFRFQADHIEWCQDYWSEPLDESNKNKRNHEASKISCSIYLTRKGVEWEERAENGFDNFGREGMSPVIVNQAVRILNWMDISGESLLTAEEKPRDLVQRVWERREEGRYKDSNQINGWPLETAGSTDLEWWHIEQTWSSDNDFEQCKTYYPQLFFGRWVPVDNYGSDDWLKRAQEHLDTNRDNPDWPDWADHQDRDIIIRLER